jgi:hypothetical protein
MVSISRLPLLTGGSVEVENYRQGNTIFVGDSDDEETSKP